MAIHIEIFPAPATRPCRYCLSLQGGSVFADFDIDNGNAQLMRISFDGHGCCNLEDSGRKMNKEDSDRFIEMIEAKNIVQDEMSAILTRYFKENTDVIWEDALVENALL